MKIIVFGARGDVGSRIVQEALARGHQVTAVVRSATQRSDLPLAVDTVVADVASRAQVEALMVGHNLAISAVRPPDGQEALLAPLTRSLLDAALRSRTRILIVGGAASLQMPDDKSTTVLTAPGFLPDAVVAIARACQEQYELCIAEHRVDWAYLSPPAMLTPGVRTGNYRLGSDVLLIGPDGSSAISMEDFAVALIDEAEAPRHSRSRFTVAAGGPALPSHTGGRLSQSADTLGSDLQAADFPSS